MHIDTMIEALNACRFCFMCRHLSAVGNVTFREADTPRGRALLAGRMQQGIQDIPADYIETFFRADLAASCRYHCVSHYDEAGLILAARRDIVEAGRAPEKVIKLARELQQVNFTICGKGDTLYYAGIHGDDSYAPKGCRVLSGGDTGKALAVLGFHAEAEAVFAQFAATVKASGCSRLITPCPASYDMLKRRLDGVTVQHTSQMLEGKKGAGKVYFLDSDYLRNYNDGMSAPRELLAHLGYELVPFGTNPEESYGAGEGAVVLDRLYPELVRKLCAHIAEQADNPGHDVIITASPYTKAVLGKFAPQLGVRLLDEFVMKGV